MAKCDRCKKAEVFETRWERVTEWLLYRLFPKRIIDIANDNHLLGFGEGYKQGFEHAMQNQRDANRNITA